MTGGILKLVYSPFSLKMPNFLVFWAEIESSLQKNWSTGDVFEIATECVCRCMPHVTARHAHSTPLQFRRHRWYFNSLAASSQSRLKIRGNWAFSMKTVSRPALIYHMSYLEMCDFSMFISKRGFTVVFLDQSYCPAAGQWSPHSGVYGAYLSLEWADSVKWPKSEKKPIKEADSSV